MEEFCLLACSPRLAQLALLWHPEPPASGLDPPTLIINEDNAPQVCLQATNGDIFLIEVPSSWMTLVCV